MLPWFAADLEQGKPGAREPPDTARQHAVESRVSETSEWCGKVLRSVAEPACDGISRLSNPNPLAACIRGGEALMHDLGDVSRDRLGLSVGLMTPWRKRLPVMLGKILPGRTMSRGSADAEPGLLTLPS